MITSCAEKEIRVYTRYSVLAWLFKSKTVDGKMPQVSPPERLDEVAETLVPEKGSRIKTPPVSLEMLSSDHIGHLLSFDGAAKRDGSGGAACILWSLPSWEIAAATGHFLEKATVNEAGHKLVVVGDSRLAIQQLQGAIGCTQPHLLRLLQEAEGLQAKFKSLRLVHVKRDFNAAANYISKRVIKEQSSLEVTDLGERKLLQGLNRIHEKLMKDPSPREQSLVECAFIATARSIPRCPPEGEAFVTARLVPEQSDAAKESTPESGTDHSESAGPGADELGTEGAEDGLTSGP
ncbi:hypothetical protein PHMEG_00028359 [Phytophthora megakarya]|uniref:RNase H type-1 domain-containing protein n=1 Tax=Phytophthora megakarya TaxID=4795 RepID=A0A225V3C4_9STRA|nr:hypothetical protein PHMEG_00028359 [Phytophthora megakarya]